MVMTIASSFIPLNFNFLKEHAMPNDTLNPQLSPRCLTAS